MTNQQYQEMMAKLHQAGKISGGSGDLPSSEADLLRKMQAGMDSRSLKPVYSVSEPMINETMAKKSLEMYDKSTQRVEQNTEELLKMGVPIEKLQPFIMKRHEQDQTIRNMGRESQPSPHDKPLMISAESELGLDPTKYTRKKWNPNDYIGFTENPKALGELMSQEKLAREQSLVLTPEVELTPEERKAQQMNLMMKSMGGGSLSEDDLKKLQLNADKKFYQIPKSQQLIKELGLEMDDGIPVLDENDSQSFESTLDADPSQLDRRTQMLRDLLTDR